MLLYNGNGHNVMIKDHTGVEEGGPKPEYAECMDKIGMW
jgi:hypothetical protein